MTNDETVDSMFEEIAETRRVNGKPMVSDEQTIQQMDFDAACEAFVQAERRFNKIDARKHLPEFDVCQWFDALESRYICEKMVWKMFCGGDRSLTTGHLYLKFRDVLFARGSLSTNA